MDRETRLKSGVSKALLDALDAEPEESASVLKSRLRELRAALYDEQDPQIGKLQALMGAYEDLHATARAAIREAVGPKAQTEDAKPQRRPMYAVTGEEVPAAYLHDTPHTS